MIVSIHQPAYLPWMGYLARIAASDIFIYLDTVQFEKNSFTNRNRIKTANGPIWLTVPVLQQGHIGKPMTELLIDPRQDWRKKHLASIANSYRRASGFARRYPLLERLYAADTPLLADLCYDQLLFWLAELGIKTKVLRASSLPVEGSKSDLVLALCRHVHATEYISGPLGRGYLQEQDFAAAGIAVHYQQFAHPQYSQLYGEFQPAMGIVDYWMNVDRPDQFTDIVKVNA
jgi:hypothetical protein